MGAGKCCASYAEWQVNAVHEGRGRNSGGGEGLFDAEGRQGEGGKAQEWGGNDGAGLHCILTPIPSLILLHRATRFCINHLAAIHHSIPLSRLWLNAG